MAPPKLRFGPRLERFAMRPPEQDYKINGLVGSVRSGKTFALHAKILYLCDYAVGGRRLLTGVSKASIKTNVLADLEDLVGSRNFKFNQQSGDLRLLGTDWIVAGAHDSGSEKYLRGATIGAAVVDEAVLMPQSYFQMLLTRLSPPNSRLYFSTNADNSEHWLKRQYLDNEELRKDRILWWDTYTMEDNITLDPGYVAAQKKLYTGVFYDRMILGQWNMAGGACYLDAWGPWTLYDDSTRPVGLYGTGGYQDHLIACDYGVHNPFVLLDAIDDGERVYIDNEHYWDSTKEQKSKTDVEYVAALKKFIADSNCPQTPKVIIDPSAASFRAACAAAGIWVGECNNEVLDGIRRTASALKQRKVVVHKKRCPNTQREHVGYAWDSEAAKRGDEKPLKQADHTCDALRYLVNEIFRYEWRLAA